jgi:hypothetical protein
MAPPSILKKKGTPKASSPSGQQEDDSMNDSLKKLQRENSLSSVDRRSAFAKMKSVSQNTEQEGSMKDLTQMLDIKKQMSMKGIQFADDVEVNEISRLRDSAIDFCFYSEESLSNFRYEAFMEDAGLDPSDYA